MVLGVLEWGEDVYWAAVGSIPSGIFVDGGMKLTFCDSLAMAEMTTLVAAVYRVYSTSLLNGCENVAPGVTSRFEVFHDDMIEDVEVCL